MSVVRMNAPKLSVSTSPLEDWLVSSLREKEAPQECSCGELSLLTVVIPCYGRQDFLLRQCVYWHGSGAALVIVDGSERSLCDGVQHTLSGLGDITYIHSTVNMMDRLKLASEYINTPYTILLGDDEFMLFAGLCSAIFQLEKNSELAACIGQSLAFYPANDSEDFTYGTGYPHWGYAIEQDDVQQRLNTAMSDYTAATCYAVLRTPVWKKSWGQLQNWSSPYAGEMQQAMTTYIWGKLTTVEEVYWMRSNENRPVTIKGFNRGLSFQEWWLSERFKSEHDSFVAILSSQLVDAQHLEYAQATVIVKEAIATLISHLEDVSQDRKMSQPVWKSIISNMRSSIVYVIKGLLPERLIDLLKSATFNFGSASSNKGSLGSLADIKRITSPTPFLMNDALLEELSAMETLVAKFYKARVSKSI